MCAQVGGGERQREATKGQHTRPTFVVTEQLSISIAVVVTQFYARDAVMYYYTHTYCMRVKFLVLVFYNFLYSYFNFSVSTL